MRSAFTRATGPEVALVVAAACFGVTFVMVKDAVNDVSPAGFIVLRFTIGAAALAPFAWTRRRRSPRPDAPASVARASLLLGVALAFGYMLQTVGLQYTSSSNSAFITGLFVVFTPLIQIALRHRGLGPVTATAVALAVAGLFLITGASFHVGVGDALTLGCAFAFAVQIVLLGMWAPRFDPLVLNTSQMTVLAVLTVPVLAITGPGALTGRAWLAIVVTGLACSSLAFSLQVYGQSRAAPTRAALLLSLEPVFAALTGYATGDGLGVVGVFGALLILAGIAVEEGGGAWWRRRAGTAAATERP